MVRCGVAEVLTASPWGNVSTPVSAKRPLQPQLYFYLRSQFRHVEVEAVALWSSTHPLQLLLVECFRMRHSSPVFVSLQPVGSPTQAERQYWAELTGRQVQDLHEDCVEHLRVIVPHVDSEGRDEKGFTCRREVVTCI